MKTTAHRVTVWAGGAHGHPVSCVCGWKEYAATKQGAYKKMHEHKRSAGDATVAVGDRVRLTEGTRAGREGTVTAVSADSLGGDYLAVVDGDWTAYDRQLEKTDRDVEALRLIAAGTAFPAEVENDLEDRGLIVQTDAPYAVLTDAGRKLIANPKEEK